MNYGKYLRFPEIFDRKNPIVVCPIDDLLLSGPIKGLEDPESKIFSILKANPTALLTFPGSIMKYYKYLTRTKLIVNLSASTTRSKYTKKILLGNIDTALRCNANAVAVHINLCSLYAEDMIRDAGIIIEQAERLNIPTVGIVYPRGENNDGSVNENDMLKLNDNSKYTELVCHCVQVAVDLGFDLIKTQYTGDKESFKKVIKMAQGTPIVTAGGPIIEESLSIKNAIDAYSVGSSGISFARNVFGRDDTTGYLNKITKELDRTNRE